MAKRKGRETVSNKKTEKVEELTKLITSYNAVGLIDLYKLPAAALQQLKNELHGQVLIKVAKKSLLKFAFNKSGDKKVLLDHMIAIPGLLLTNENPFKIYNVIKKKKSKAGAKPGDIATSDVVVSAGPTDLPPGPAISTLSSVKVPAKVQDGKIAILRDVTVCREGETVSAELAPVLSMLKIRPMEIGLNVVAMLEDGTVYLKDVLNIDEEQTLADLSTASTAAFNLAVNANYPTSETIEFLISKAFDEAKNLAIDANIIESDIIGDLLAKAAREAKAIEGLVPDVPVEEGKEEEIKEGGKDDSRASNDKSSGEKPKEEDEEIEKKAGPEDSDTDNKEPEEGKSESSDTESESEKDSDNKEEKEEN